MKCSFDLFSTLVLALVQGTPVSAAGRGFSCDKTKNFVKGQTYSQIALTDGCANGVCDANPKYGAPNDPDRAISWCEDACSGGEDCTGFFFQTHPNGHEICGFFKSEVDESRAVWHGHKNGAVCLRAAADDLPSCDWDAELWDGAGGTCVERSDPPSCSWDTEVWDGQGCVEGGADSDGYGCDGAYGSDKILDACGVCGGDGSSCDATEVCGGAGLNQEGCCGDEAKNCEGRCLPAGQIRWPHKDCQRGLTVECALELAGSPCEPGSPSHPGCLSNLEINNMCPNQFVRTKTCTQDFQSFECYGKRCGNGVGELSCDGFVCETADEHCRVSSGHFDITCEHGTTCEDFSDGDGQIDCRGDECTSSSATATGNKAVQMFCMKGSRCTADAGMGSQAQTFMLCQSGSFCSCTSSGSGLCVIQCELGAGCSCNGGNKSVSDSRCIWA